MKKLLLYILIFSTLKAQIIDLGKSPYTVTECKKEVISHENWMREDFAILKEKTLDKIVLPGSHDSGSYNLKLRLAPDAPIEVRELISRLGIFGLKKFILKIVKKWAECQNHNILNQLNCGIRYFDMRVMWDELKQDFRTHHSLVGPSFLEILHDIKKFSDGHPQELILVDISTLNLDDSNYYDLFKLILELIGSKLLPQDYNFSKTFAEIIDLKTPVVLFLDKKLPYSADLFWDRKYLKQTWADVNNVQDLIKIESKAVINYKDYNSFFKLQWVLTPDFKTILESLIPFNKTRSLKDLSQYCNIKLQQFSEQMANYSINILMLDFASESSVLKIARERNLAQIIW